MAGVTLEASVAQFAQLTYTLPDQCREITWYGEMRKQAAH